ncbi:hypothetical protein DFJ63DRAFT_30609 [Scheffersomyces coipomensis]|uniref:uncharacterized protein n=1 Tax=Scheffersomyces coipomensis TaxID=1788519 RepID=UPI00315CE69F
MAKRDPSIKRSRTRSGCLTCRDRHMKCDEQQPICRNCIKSKRKCYRGIRLNFTQYTMYNPSDQTPINDFIPQPSSYRLLDQSITIASLYKNGKESYRPYIHLHSNQDLTESDLQYQQDLYATITPATVSSTSTSLSTSLKTGSSTTITGSSISTINEVQMPSQLDTNTVIENYNITNLLLTDSYFINQSFNTPSTSSTNLPLMASSNTPKFQFLPNNLHTISSQWNHPNNLTASGDTSPTSTIDYPQSNFDIQLFISIIEREKYYWFLDQFNEQNIWKSMIPMHCLQQQYQLPLLINSLINCSNQFNLDILSNLLDQQLGYWYNIRSNSVINSLEINKFENLLISIVLILLSIYLKYQSNPTTINYISLIIDNQCKLYNKVIFKINSYLNSSKREQKSLLLISSIHSILILKYFIIKKFQFEIIQDYNYSKVLTSAVSNHQQQQQQLNPDQVSSSNIDIFPPIDIMEDITYLTTSSQQLPSIGNVSLNNLFQLSQFEIINLNQSFKKLDYIQLNYRYQSSTSLSSSSTSLSGIAQSSSTSSTNSSSSFTKSDSSKLRDYMWYLIKLNYIILNPHIKSIEIDYNFIFNLNQNNIMLPSSSATSLPNMVFPNDRGVMINFLQEFINKLINVENKFVIQQSNQKILSIFKLLDQSFKLEDEKSRWKYNFEWVLNFITDND